jgi:hypothetical protein
MSTVDDLKDKLKKAVVEALEHFHYSAGMNRRDELYDSDDDDFLDSEIQLSTNKDASVSYYYKDEIRAMQNKNDLMHTLDGRSKVSRRCTGTCFWQIIPRYLRL